MLPENENKPVNTEINKFSYDTYMRKLFSQSADVLKSLNQDAKFIDDLFPPCANSISNINLLSQQSDSKSKKKAEKRDYEWMRISEVLPEHYLLRILKSQDELIDDVLQGDLGDCYFLSALSAFAERKKRVEEMFNNLEVNSTKGCYIVNAFIDGKSIQIILDDYFPVNTVLGEVSLAFSSIEEQSKNIWPVIIEKAWAKANGNYKNIVIGNVSEAFEFLTPCPQEIYSHLLTENENSIIEKNELYLKIKKADEEDSIICCDISNNSGISNPILSSIGLLSNHAYSVISVHEILSKNGEHVRLLKIRNPWGSLEWNGNWSDSSDCWTPELKAKLNMTNKDDGFFFMEFKDFCRFFTTTYICRYNVNYKYTWKEFTTENRYCVLDMKLEIGKDIKDRDFNGYVILSQRASKVYKSLSGDNNYSNDYVTVMIINKGNNNLVGTFSGLLDRIFIKAEFTPGEYLIIVKYPQPSVNVLKKFSDFFDSDSDRDREQQNCNFLIGVYSNYKTNEVSFSTVKMDTDKKLDFEKVLFNSIVNFADHTEDKKENFYKQGEPSIWRYMNFNPVKDSCGYLVYKNDSNAVISETLSFDKLTNIRIMPFTGHGDNSLMTDDYFDVLNEDRNEAILLEKVINLEKKQNKSSNMKSSIQNKVPNSFDLTIYPFSYFVVLFEKTEDSSMFISDSIISLSYPISFLWTERKFLGKKQRLKYHDLNIEIYESIVRHPGGVLFKYKNKTKDYRVEVIINIEVSENLKNDEKYDSIKTLNQEEINEKQIKIKLEPGEYTFSNFTSINALQNFSVETNINYKISKCE